MLTGLVVKILTDGSMSLKRDSPEQTEWLCEPCDQVYVQIRKDGIITFEEWDRRFGEEEEPLYFMPDDDQPREHTGQDDRLPTQGNWSDRWDKLK